MSKEGGILDRFNDWRRQRPVNQYIFYLVVAFIIVTVVDYYSYGLEGGIEKFWNSLWTEFHGIMIDVLVFGIMLSIYDEKRRATKLEEQYRDELRDYKDWKEKQSVYRTTGIIRRMNRNLGLSEIDLSDWYLIEADLDNLDLSGSNLSGADLSNADLRGTKLADTIFSRQTNLYKAIVSDPNWFDYLEEANVVGIEDLKDRYTLGPLEERGGKKFYTIIYNITGEDDEF